MCVCVCVCFGLVFLVFCHFVCLEALSPSAFELDGPSFSFSPYPTHCAHILVFFWTFICLHVHVCVLVLNNNLTSVDVDTWWGNNNSTVTGDGCVDESYNKKSSNVGKIVGIVFGAIFATIACCLGTCYLIANPPNCNCHCPRRRHTQPRHTPNRPNPSAPPMPAPGPKLTLQNDPNHDDPPPDYASSFI